ncbi:putative monovalent cation/H+ antiporter subunit A [Marivita sp. S6314]|uniref:putative monovalent cation/H+ antiporter subunit A n=1 Tax=Marivita sp. S6314 TaxID=2926406 RepID=UPI001FF310C2|nr:putative monovalent cation/H+ antiporter subunit A [Marivita sp. S6314]MCK0149896.1 putative monovalent cation/H+ antiporter subunit A [Marivita sp. S6314]
MADGVAHNARGNGWVGIVPVLFAAALFTYFVSLMPTIAGLEAIRFAAPWIPSLGIEFAFLVDGLSLTFALLISGIGTLVLLYSNTYLAGHPQYARFALFLTAFMVSMLGLVLADDLILLFVFWELTTFTSYMLIGFSHDSEKSRRNALQALFVTGAGGLAFLAGLIMLGAITGTSSISEILTMGEALKAHALYVPILILLLAGTFTKSAQVPFHFWLPNAMAAPTPVSAFLHSATMVKAGVYVMARMHPAMSGTDIWLWTLTIFGAVTAVFASFLSLRQTDLKQALAYTTLMALGTLTLFLGQESGYAMTAFAAFLIVHSLYKASLFLIVGCIDKSTGTRETDQLGGLARLMPVTTVAAALAAMSMAGFPPFLGFIGKELKYAGAIAVTSEPVLVAGAALLANSLMLAVAGVVAFRPFWRGTVPSTQSPKEAPWQMLAGPVILASLGALFGIYPDLLQTALIDPTVLSLTGQIEEAKELKLWAGVNIPLVLSIATFVLGLIIYAFHVQVRAVIERVFSALPNLDRGWDRFLDALKAFAKWQTNIVQNGRLSSYTYVTFLTIAAGIFLTFLYTGLPAITVDLSDVEWKHTSIALLIAAGALLTLFTNSRIAAIAALGVVGIGIALIFIVFSAPDVAITQLLVETLIVVLVAVVMLRLPLLPKMEFRLNHAVLSVAVGAAVSLILISVVSSPLDLRLTEYFEVTSWPEAYGRNIVNVILVDFRALDTFGEIAVVVIAALSAYALLRTTRKGDEK